MSPSHLRYTTDCGIPGLGKIPWGTHFCQFYAKQEDLVQTLVPYFRAGLQNGELCLWVTSDPFRANDAQAKRAKVMPALDDLIKEGRIQIRDFDEWYTNAASSGDEIVENWLKEEEKAIEAGYQGLRIAGNAGFITRADWDAFSIYESHVHAAFKNRRIVALCSYNQNQCHATDIFQVIRNHLFTIGLRDGNWEILEPEMRQSVLA